MSKLNIWTQSSGYSFGIFEEQVSLSTPGDPLPGIKLPVENDAGVSYELISGVLPDGLFLEGNRIIGAPMLISNNVDYNFCIRATKSGYQIPDRTFTMVVNGATPPIYITPPGLLATGPHKQLYALDGSYISYQIDAFALDPKVKKLSYFIAGGDGKLPPGITLSDTGLLSGFITPILINSDSSNAGNYDTGFFDNIAYDYNVAVFDGFDSYSYDDVFFDFNSSVKQPFSLNVNYQFKVTVTDGTNYEQRVFRILVVGDDQFRADSTVKDGFAGVFTADSTFLRNPVWISNSNLGIVRADNYITIPVALYDNTNTEFSLNPVNNEVLASAIKLSSADNEQTDTYVTVSSTTAPVAGYYFSFYTHIPKATSDIYQILDVYELGNNQYRLSIDTPLLISVPNETMFYIGTLSKLPTGTSFDINTGEVYGTIPYQPAITKVYKFTISATRFGIKNGQIVDTVNSSKTFTISVLGNVTSEITWNTPSNLGVSPAEYISTLSVSASSNVPNAVVIYSLVDGSLPPGLSLSIDGEIIGKINQYYNASTGLLGITTVDTGNTTFDANTTSVDKTFTFTVQASDQYNYSASTREFTIAVSTPNTVNYSNLSVQPFLSPAHRQSWNNFINDTSIFTPASIYRTNNTDFGIQSKLKMLIYAGIETTEVAAYVSVLGLNHKKKRFAFGNVKKAIAIDPVTNESLYEVVYIEMTDPREHNSKHLPSKLHFESQYSTKITVDAQSRLTGDSSGYDVSDPNTNSYFPSSISIWRNKIKNMIKISGYDNNSDPEYSKVLSERNYLPLWMRSVQAGSRSQLDFVAAVPLCFCKVGTANDILLNIKHSNFDFKLLDYTVDRYIIDSVQGYDRDKYLIFRDDRITV